MLRGAAGAGAMPPLAPSAAASAAASAPTPRRSASTGLLRRGSSLGSIAETASRRGDAISTRGSIAEVASPSKPAPPSKPPVKVLTAEQASADPVAAAAAERRRLISAAVDALAAALRAWSVGVSEAGSLLGLELGLGLGLGLA